MSKLELCGGNTPELEDLGKILNIWHKRAQRYMGSNYSCAEAVGNESLETIFLRYGKEPALKLLDLENGLNLETQARLLSLGRRDAPILMKVTEAYRKRLTPWELLKRIGSKDNLSFQEGVYEKVVKEMLEVKFPGQDTLRLMKKYPSASNTPHEFFWNVEVSLQRGPDFLLEAFNFISPEEIRPDSFDKRLKFEKRAREEGQKPVKRVYSITGKVVGVGFRDFCGIRSSKLWGKSWARNEGGHVILTLEGLPEILDKYMADFCQDATETLGIPLPNMILEKELPVLLTKKSA